MRAAFFRRGARRNSKSAEALCTPVREAAVVVDPEAREATDQIFFSATVGLLRGDGREQTVKIVGVDEIDTSKNKISWISPLARSLIKAREGDEVVLDTPEGREIIEILSVEYIKID